MESIIMRHWPNDKQAQSRLGRQLNECRMLKAMREPAPDYPPDMPQTLRKIVVTDYMADGSEIEHTVTMHPAIGEGARRNQVSVCVDGKHLIDAIGPKRFQREIFDPWIPVYRWTNWD